MSSVNEIKITLDYLIKKVEEIDQKVNKIIKFLNELELIHDNLTYLISITLSERARKAYEELKKLRNTQKS